METTLINIYHSTIAKYNFCYCRTVLACVKQLELKANTDAFQANFGEAGYRLELRRRGEYQSFVT